MTLTFLIHTGEVSSSSAYDSDETWKFLTGIYSAPCATYGDPEMVWSNTAIRNGNKILVCGSTVVAGYVD